MHSERSFGVVDYDIIRKRHGGEDFPPRMFIRRAGLILALCLSADEHPRINNRPAEVWITEAEDWSDWTERLAYDTGAILLYVRRNPLNGYRARGVYHVMGSSDDRVELACRTALFSERLSRIVFLSGPHWR